MTLSAHYLSYYDAQKTRMGSLYGRWPVVLLTEVIQLVQEPMSKLRWSSELQQSSRSAASAAITVSVYFPAGGIGLYNAVGLAFATAPCSCCQGVPKRQKGL